MDQQQKDVAALSALAQTILGQLMLRGVKPWNTMSYGGEAYSTWKQEWDDVLRHNPEVVMLGEGAFSVCLMHKGYPDMVMKLSIAGGDVGPAYWRRCMEVENVYHPPVYNTGRVRHFFWCVAKRLYPRDDGDLSQRDQHYALSDACSGEGDDEDARDIVEWATALGEWDLHSGNVMWDEDGRIYINDPASIRRGHRNG